ncbi:MAG TPA: SgcJ/EcaC family oxidoreductase [Bryobacteraceae bacterium]|nr:SgcJ/EcaC family oxidoreductase [Bryobacteraceae bacterium]
MRRIGVLALSAAAVILGGCSDTPTVDKVAIEKSVKGVEAAMVKAAGAKDAAAFAANYAADAVLMTPGMAPMKGTDGIKAGMAGILADPALKLDFSSDRVEVAESGDMAASRGSYAMTMTDPSTKKAMSDKGSYVTVFRKQKDGAWKAVLDINASEVPPPAPPAPKAAGKSTKKKGKKR